jgi:hypothetical protein
MADSKIEDLVELATAPAGTDVLAIVDDPSSKCMETNCHKRCSRSNY